MPGVLPTDSRSWFVRQITLGSILTALTVLFGLGGQWMLFQFRLDQTERQITETARLLGERRSEDARALADQRGADLQLNQMQFTFYKEQIIGTRSDFQTSLAQGKEERGEIKTELRGLRDEIRGLRDVLAGKEDRRSDLDATPDVTAEAQRAGPVDQ